MKLLRIHTFVSALLVCAGSAYAQSPSPMRSFFPKGQVAEFLVKNLDIASFRSSLGPRRGSKRTFAELGMKPSNVDGNLIEFEDTDWYYAIRVLERSDQNNDGIEDLAVCFTDRAKQGSYSTQRAMLITKYSTSTFAVAVDYKVSGCEEFGGEG